MSYTVILKSLLNFLKRMLFLYFRKQKPVKIVIYFPKRKHFLYFRKQKPLKIVIYFPKRKHFLYFRKRRKNLRKNYLYSRKQLSEHEKIKRIHYQRSFFYFRKLNLFGFYHYFVDCVFPCHQRCCFFCQVHRAFFLHCTTSVKELSVHFLL